MTAPAAEYEIRLDRLRATLADLDRADRRFSNGRLFVFAMGLATLALWWLDRAPIWLSLAPLVVFLYLVQRHDRLLTTRDNVRRAIAFYERGIARLEDRWIGTGEEGNRFRDDSHLYSNDLDIFGRGSLFELLSTARTRAGEEALAAWLTSPAAPDLIRQRQDGVGEMAPLLDLREQLSLAGSDVRAGVDGDALVTWAEGGPILKQSWRRTAAVILTASVLAAGAYAALSGNYAPVVAVLLLEALFSIPQRARVQQALHAATGPARDLDVLAHVLRCIEKQHFRTAHLAALRRELDTGGLAGSAAIGRLHRLVELHDWQHNQFFAPIAAALLWGTHVAWAIERWRRAHGPHVRIWLRASGEFEAFASVAAYRYEHPDDVWPEIATGEALFDAEGLGHPLLPRSRMVRNDVHLRHGTRLLVVSGSNMSGKSTLLRTVGINAVLSLMGAPVCAARLRLTPVAVGATLRIQDSLQEGRSRFYAEIVRIRQLADLARGGIPLLFLLDELFHGTNSHDRLVGAAGVLRSLLARGAIGLVTTHDLALTAIARELAPHADNVHFEDWFESGEIRFDYRMKPGPVTRSNAVALMRAVGLEVDPTPDPAGIQRLP